MYQIKTNTIKFEKDKIYLFANIKIILFLCVKYICEKHLEISCYKIY